MKHKQSVTTHQSRIRIYERPYLVEHCTCAPISSLPDEMERSDQDITPVPPGLQRNISTTLARYFPRSTPFSLVLIHISQLEPLHIAPQGAVLAKRQRFHAPVSFLTQVMENVRRTIRGHDLIATDEGRGAAIFLPDVDRYGASAIIDRIYEKVTLLQPETVIPPLWYETDIVFGVGSYPTPALSEEDMLLHTAATVCKITFRPAIMMRLWENSSHNRIPGISAQPQPSSVQEEQKDEAEGQAHHGMIPFMRLPETPPARLKHFIPYALACELQCVPVGRDHSSLTVAMADPVDDPALQRLREYTGMTIFPVACEPAELQAILDQKW